MPPGTSSLDPPDLVSVHGAPERRWSSLRRRCGAHRACWVPPGETLSPDRVPAHLLVPGAALSAPGHGPAERPHPECGSRNSSSRTTSSSSSHVWKLGIGPLCAAQRPNGPVGPLWAVSVVPVVDTWTTRRPCTAVAVRPPPVPCLPRSVPRPCAAPSGRDVRAALDLVGGAGVYRAGQRGRGRRRHGAATDPARCPAPSTGVTGTARDLPNLCTFLGTTSRRVDRGHRPVCPRSPAV